jgi:hypothetical protein
VSKKARKIERKKDSKEWVRKEGRKEGRNQKKERDEEWVRKKGIKSTKTGRKRKRAMKRERTRERACVFYKPSFLPFFPSLLFPWLLCFLEKLSANTRGKKKTDKKTTTRTTTLVVVPRLSRKLVERKTEKQQRQQTSALHQKTCRAPDSDTTDKEKERKSGRSERPVLRANTIITRRFGGPLRAWVAGSIITRNTDSIITRSWDSIITPKGFRKIILA